MSFPNFNPGDIPIQIGVTVIGSGDIPSNPRDGLPPGNIPTPNVPIPNPDIQEIQKEAEEKKKREEEERAAAQQTDSGNGEITTDSTDSKILINGYVNYTFVKKVTPIANDVATKHDEYRDENVPLLVGEIKEEAALLPKSSPIAEAVTKYVDDSGNRYADFDTYRDAISSSSSDDLNYYKAFTEIGTWGEQAKAFLDNLNEVGKYLTEDPYKNENSVFRYIYRQGDKEYDVLFYEHKNGLLNTEKYKAVEKPSLGQQLKEAGKILNKKPGAVVKNGLGKLSKLEKASLIFSGVAVGVNVADSFTEIKNAWNDDEKATFGERLRHFGDNFKAQNHEKYDNLNSSIIDVGSGIAAVGVGLMAAPGAAAALAITGGFLLVNAAAKTYYYAYQHEDVDIWKTFRKNLNLLDGGYTTKQSESTNNKSGETTLLERMRPFLINVKGTEAQLANFSSDNYVAETKADVKIDELSDGKETAVLEPPLLTETKADVITTRGGNGNDILLNSDSSKVILMGEDADDLIVNQGSANVTIMGGTGNDTVTNVTSSNVKIYGEEGNDFINNFADTVEIFAGTGDNTIKNFGSAEVSIIAAQGNDFIDNISDGTLIDAGDGKNLVENIGAEVSIKTGSGSDEIHSCGVKVQTDSGEGDDSIESEGDEVTIKAGAGDNAKGHKFIDIRGNCNDISLAGETGYVKSVGDANTIKANTRTGLIEVVGNETEIIGNKGNIEVFVYGGLHNSVSGSTESDVVYNSSDKGFIDMGAGDDSVTNHGQQVVIFTGTGDNFVKNTRYTHWNYTMHKWMTTGTSPDDVIIAGAADADTIYNYGGQKASINGYDGADRIFNATKPCDLPDPIVYVEEKVPDLDDEFAATGSPLNNEGLEDDDSNNVNEDISDDVDTDTAPDNATLLGGKGDDYIGNDGAKSFVSGGDGSDTIYNSGEGSTLSGDSGNDTVENTGAQVSISGGDGSDTISNDKADNVTIDGGDGNNVIKNTAGKNVSISGGADNDSIFNGVIFGFGSGTVGAYTLSPDNVTINTGAGDDTVTNEGENTVFIFSGGNDTIYGFNATSTLSIGDGTGSYSKANVDKNIVVTTADGTVILMNATNLKTVKILGTEILPTLTLTNANNAKQTLNADFANADASARTKATRITGNTLDNSILGGSGKDTLYGNNGNDYLEGGKGNDKLSGQNGNDTLWGGTGNDTLTGGAGADVFVCTAGNDVIADFATGDKISVNAAISASSVKGANATFTIGSNTLTVTKGKGQEIVFVDTDGNERTIIGGAFLATNSTAAKVTLGSGIEVGDATARTTGTKMAGNALDNSIFGGSGKDSLYGNIGNDYLVGNAGNDKLFGQNGDDTLHGGEGSDTLTGGEGADVFIYTAGNDVIADYATGDKISIGTAVSKSYIKGTDATFTIGSNTLTVTKGKGQEIVFIDADGNERTIIGGAFMATNSTAAKVTLGSGVEVGDATERTTAIKMVGNALDNSIFGGSGKDSLYGNTGDDYLAGNAGNDKLYGQNGDDTLWGGTGNDTLTGGAGADVFIYTSGKDTIADYQINELLQIMDGTFSKAAYSSSTLTLTMDGGGSVVFTNVNSSTKFNINGTTYHVSGKTII